jgi:hypothetical protein
MELRHLRYFVTVAGDSLTIDLVIGYQTSMRSQLTKANIGIREPRSMGAPVTDRSLPEIGSSNGRGRE